MNKPPLPPGQHEIEEFPRFGLTHFAHRFPRETSRIELRNAGDVGHPAVLSDELESLKRIDQVSDFHCVTTWTYRSVQWSGVRFSDFFEQIVMPQIQPAKDATFVVFRCQDRYSVSLRLDDLLANDVMLADKLDGEPLSIAHGAPVRLVAPAHYGYKSAKHLDGIEFWRDDRKYRSAAYSFMDHPRARVNFEERGKVVPGWLLRFLYRPLIRRTIRLFQKTLAEHLDTSK